MRFSRRTFLQSSGLIAGAAVTGWAVRQGKSVTSPLLRPPGSSGEDAFLSRCIRCAQCIVACPTDVLRAAGPATGTSLATPHFLPRERACDLCQGREQMECIAACPTEALEPITERRSVRIGVAKIDNGTCWPFVGVSCKACWHACPFPNEAIVFTELGRPIIVSDACVGCGLCEYACLTEETSIRVVPHDFRDSENAIGAGLLASSKPPTEDLPESGKAI